MLGPSKIRPGLTHKNLFYRFVADFFFLVVLTRNVYVVFCKNVVDVCSYDRDYVLWVCIRNTVRVCVQVPC